MELEISKIETEAQTALANVGADLQRMKAEADALIVKDDATAAVAATMLKAAKGAGKRAEEIRKSLTAPLKAYIDNLAALFKPREALAGEIQIVINKKIVAYTTERERIEREAEEKRRAEERAALEKQKEAADEVAAIEGTVEAGVKARMVEAAIETLDGPIDVDTAIRTGGATVSTVKRWTYRIDNEDEVPREFCSPDRGKIMAAVRAGKRAIPGVTIYQDVSTAVR